MNFNEFRIIFQDFPRIPPNLTAFLAAFGPQVRNSSFSTHAAKESTGMAACAATRIESLTT